jgi:hypothetical protein
VGPNTPVVTSIPASNFGIAAAVAGAQVTYARINPDGQRVHSDSPDLAREWARVQPAAAPGSGSLEYIFVNAGWSPILPQVAAAVAELRKASDTSSATTTTAAAVDVELRQAAAATSHRLFQQGVLRLLMYLCTPHSSSR